MNGLKELAELRRLVEEQLVGNRIDHLKADRLMTAIHQALAAVAKSEEPQGGKKDQK